MMPIQRILAVVFDGAAVDDALVGEIAQSAELQAELVRMAGVLAEMPGDGARAAEGRLDALLDTVTLVAASEIVAAPLAPHRAR